MNKEIRSLDIDLELRTLGNNSENDDEMIIEGYAIVYNSPATYNYTEIISNSALDNTDMSDVVLRYNHNDTFLVLARTRNKSLELIKDEKGLKIRAKLNPKITEHRNVYEAIKSGLIDKMSFAFTIRGSEYNYETNTKTITDIDKLYDVAVVDQPFYDATSLFARSIEKSNNDIKKLRKEYEIKQQQKEDLDSAKKDLLNKLN